MAINLVLSSRPEPTPSSPRHPSPLPAPHCLQGTEVSTDPVPPAAPLPFPVSSSADLCKARRAPHHFCLQEGQGRPAGVFFWEGQHIYTAIKNKNCIFLGKLNREESFGASTRDARCGSQPCSGNAGASKGASPVALQGRKASPPTGAGEEGSPQLRASRLSLSAPPQALTDAPHPTSARLKFPIHAPPAQGERDKGGCIFFLGAGDKPSPRCSARHLHRRAFHAGKTLGANAHRWPGELLPRTGCSEEQTSHAPALGAHVPITQGILVCPGPPSPAQPSSRLKNGDKCCSYLEMNNPEAAGGEDSTCKRKQSKRSW